MPRKRNTREKTTLEDMYCNKHFVPPKEKNLETIFEEPRRSKDGTPVLTSVKKYKRYLHFEPTPNKILKRKKKAKKCSKLQSKYRVTRSSPGNSKSEDVLMYILDTVGDCDSSNDGKSGMSNANDETNCFLNSDTYPAVETSSAKDVCDTPKRNCNGPRTFQLQSQVETLLSSSETVQESEMTSNESLMPNINDDDETGEPRRLPMKSMEILAH